MNVTKANVSISTIDSTTRSNTFDDTWNAVVVVNTPTGPYEKTQISSKTKFIEKYLTSDSISSDDDLTIQNTAFLLDSMPLTVIRASSVKVRAGITVPSGLPIYTDGNYDPFTYSTSFEIPENVGANCYPQLCIEADGEKYAWLVEEVYNEGNLYSSDVQNYASGDNLTLLTEEQGFTKETQGIDALLKGFENWSNSNKIDGLKIDTTNSKYFVAYMTDDVEIQLLPEWIYESNTSDLSYDVSKTTFTPNQDLTIGDYLSVNGYYFYYTSGSTNNFVTTGTPVAVKVSSTDLLLGEGGLGVGIFSIYVKDLLRSSSTYKDPLITDETMSVTLNPASGSYKITGGIDSYLSQDGNSLTIKTTTVLSSANTNDGYCLELGFGDNVGYNTKTSGKVTEKPVQFKTDPDTKIKSAEVTDIGVFSAGQNSIVITTKTGTTVTIDDSAVLSKTSLIEDGKYTFTYGTSTVTFDYLGGTITIENAADGWSSLNAYVIYPLFDENTSTVVRFFCDYNSVPYVYVDKDTGTASTLVETISTTSGKITIEKFLLKVASILNSDKKYDELFGRSEDDEESSEGVVFELSKSVMYSLNSVYKELTTNDELKITIEREVPGFKKVSISRDSENLSHLTYWFVLKIGTYTFYNNPDYTASNNKEILVEVGSGAKMSKQEFLTEVFSSISHNTTYYSTDDGESEFTLFSKATPDYTASIQVGNDDGYEDAVELEATIKSYDSETAERGAIIQKFASKVPLSTFKMDANDDNTYEITLAYKEDSHDYTVSFDPKNALDGYGTNIYWDYINNSSNYFVIKDLNMDAPVSAVSTIEFGDEIYPTEPTLTDYEVALDILKNKKDGNYYDYICTVGYDNANYIKYAVNVGKETYTQVFSAVPCTINDVDQAISFRETTGIDDYQGNMFYPYFYTSAVGEFTALISPACAALEKAYNNKLAYKEFVPLFWKEYGVVSVPTTYGSMNGMINVVTETEDQNNLISNQINPVVIDEYLNITYLLDHMTMQKIDSDLSDSCNVRMINVISHVADQIMDGFIAKDNNKLWRDQVVTQLTNSFTERFASQQRSYANMRIVCDETNNPIEVVRARQLVVDIYIQFEVAVKYIKVYNRVIPLEES